VARYASAATLIVARRQFRNFRDNPRRGTDRAPPRRASRAAVRRLGLINLPPTFTAQLGGGKGGLDGGRGGEERRGGKKTARNPSVPGAARYFPTIPAATRKRRFSDDVRLAASAAYLYRYHRRHDKT